MQVLAGHLIFEVRKCVLTDRHEASSACFFFYSQIGDSLKGFVCEFEFHIDEREVADMLSGNRALGVFENEVEVFSCEILQEHSDGQASHQLFYQAILHEIFGGGVGEVVVPFSFREDLSLESHPLLMHPFLYDVFQAGKCASDDEQHISCAYGGGFVPAKVHHTLHHRERVAGADQVHFRLFHGLEELGLDSCTGYVTAYDTFIGSDFIDLVYEDHPAFREFYVSVGLAHQVPHQVFHVFAHVAGFAQFSCVALDQGYSQDFSQPLEEEGLTHAGIAHHYYVVLLVFFVWFAGFQFLFHMLVVIIGCVGKIFLGGFLLYDILVQFSLYLLGGEVEVYLHLLVCWFLVHSHFAQRHFLACDHFSADAPDAILVLKPLNEILNLVLYLFLDGFISVFSHAHQFSGFYSVRSTPEVSPIFTHS